MAGSKAFDFWKTREEDTKESSRVKNNASRNSSEAERTSVALRFPRNASFHATTSNTSEFPRKSVSGKKMKRCRPSSVIDEVSEPNTLGPAFKSRSTWYTTFTDVGEKVISANNDILEHPNQKKNLMLCEKGRPPVRITVTENGNPSSQLPFRRDTTAETRTKTTTTTTTRGCTRERPIPPPKPSINVSLKPKKKIGHTTSLKTTTVHQNTRRQVIYIKCVNSLWIDFARIYKRLCEFKYNGACRI